MLSMSESENKEFESHFSASGNALLTDGGIVAT
jgi:hypothetical protein